MSKKLTDIESIGPTYAEKLAGAGCTTQEALLEKAAKPADRKEIASKTGIDEKRILNWVNRADLARVKGIGGEWADLLEHSGVDTVPELGTRNAKNLFEKIQEVNSEKNLCRSLPSESQIEDWVVQAKSMDKKIFY